MTDKATQQTRYTLTPQGCEATGGHRLVGDTCALCGVVLGPVAAAISEQEVAQ